MLKSNSKTAQKRIVDYIVRGYNVYDYGEKPSEKEILKAVYETFRSEYINDYNRNRNEYDNFFNWCGGLPSIIDTGYFYNRSAIEDVAKLLDESYEQKSKYTEQEAEKILTWFIYREIKRVIK